MNCVYTITLEPGISKIAIGTRHILDDYNNLIIIQDAFTVFVAQKWLCVEIKPSQVT